MTRNASPFSSFRQRWISDDTKSESSRKANKNGLSTSDFFEKRSDRKSLTSSSDSSSKHEILGRSSPLTKLKEFHFAREARSSSKSNRAGSGVGSRSNLALAERLASTSFGRSQPLFEHRKTFQLHESRNKLREEGAIPQAGERSEQASRSRSGSLSGEPVSRSRSSSLSSVSEEKRGLLEEQGLGSPRFTRGEGSGVDRRTFRHQQTEHSVRKEGNLRGADATVSSHAIEERLKRHKQRLAEKMAKANPRESPAAAKKQCDPSTIIQRILNDRSRPFHNKHDSTFPSKSDGAMIFRHERKFETETLTCVSSISSTDSLDSQETVILQDGIIGAETDGKKDTTTTVKTWGKQHSQEQQYIGDQSSKLSERRHISEVAQAIVSEIRLMRDGTKDNAGGQLSWKPGTATARISEKAEMKQDDVGDMNSKTGAQGSVRRRFENFENRNTTTSAQFEGQSPRKPGTVTRRIFENVETKQEDVGDSILKAGKQGEVRRRFVGFDDSNISAAAQSEGQSPKKPSTVTGRIFEKVETKQDAFTDLDSKIGPQSTAAQSKCLASRKPSTGWRRITEKLESRQEDLADTNLKTGAQTTLRKRFENSNTTEVAQPKSQSLRKTSTVTRKTVEKIETKQEDVVDSNSKAATHSNVRQRFENVTEAEQSKGQSPRKSSTVTRKTAEKVETKQEDLNSNSKTGAHSNIRQRFENNDVTEAAQFEGQSIRKPSTVTRRITEKVEVKQENVVDSNLNTIAQSNVRQRFETSDLTEAASSDIDKRGVVSSHIDLDGVIKINQAIANEISEKKKGVGAQEFKIRKTNSMSIPPSVSPKPGPRTSSKPSPTQEVVLGGEERIKIAVQLPEDNSQENSEVSQDSEGCVEIFL